MWRADASITAGVYNTKRQSAVRAASAELWDSTDEVWTLHRHHRRRAQNLFCVRLIWTRVVRNLIFKLRLAGPPAGDLFAVIPDRLQTRMEDSSLLTTISQILHSSFNLDIAIAASCSASARSATNPPSRY